MKKHLPLLILLLSVFMLFPVFSDAETAKAPESTAPVQTAEGRPWLGVAIQDVGKDMNKTGALVAEVSPGSPAAGAGVMPGDIIVSVNGKGVSSTSDLVSMIQAAGVGATVALSIDRNGKAENVSVVLGKAPEETAPMYSAQQPMPGCPMCGAPQGCAGDGGCCAGGCGGTGAGMPGGMCGQGPGMMGGPGMGMMGGPGMMHGRGMMMGGPGNMGMMKGEKYGKMYLMALSALDLNEAQAKKSEALRNDYSKRSIKSASEIAVAEVDLGELLSAEPVKLDKVKAKISEIYAKKADLRYFRVKSLEDFKKILTKEQAGKLKEMFKPAAGCPSMTGPAEGADAPAGE